MGNASNGCMQGNFPFVGAEWGEMSQLAYSTNVAKTLLLALGLHVPNSGRESADDVLECGIRVWWV
jgi:hypothetical protein